MAHRILLRTLEELTCDASDGFNHCNLFLFWHLGPSRKALRIVLGFSLIKQSGRWCLYSWNKDSTVTYFYGSGVWAVEFDLNSWSILEWKLQQRTQNFVWAKKNKTCRFSCSYLAKQNLLPPTYVYVHSVHPSKSSHSTRMILDNPKPKFPTEKKKHGRKHSG